MKKIYLKRKRKKWVKIMQGLVGFLVIGLFVLSIHKVNAGSNDSSLEKNRVDGIYAIANVNGETHLYYFNMYTMNGIYSYCIDLGVDITTGIYNSTSDFTISSLSSEQIEYIQSISYFGISYPGHEDYRFYMAAQEIIWEYLSGASVYWTSEFSVDGAEMNIDSFKKEILSLREKFYQELKFENEDNLVVYVGDTIVLTDYNELLGWYTPEVWSNSDVKVVDNSIYIDTDDFYIGDSFLYLKMNSVYDNASTLYYYDNSQRMISAGEFTVMKKYIWFKTYGSSLNIQLVDYDTKLAVAQGEASLENAEYELYNESGELVKTISTDEKGQAEVINLPNGHYSLVQIKASEGYLLNENAVYIDINYGDVSIEVEEEVIKNTIEIFKTYGKNEDGKYYLEAGVGFSIYNKNELYDTIYTDELGEVSVTLPYGVYVFKQKNSVYGYATIDDFEVVVNSEQEEAIRYNFVDNLIEVKVIVETLDMETGDAIESDEIAYKIKVKDENEYLSLDGEDEFSTEISGKVFLPFDFIYGEYVLEQIKVSSSYMLNEDTIDVVIGDESNLEVIDGELVLTVYVYNSLIRGSVSVATNEEVFNTYENGYAYEKKVRDEVQVSLCANEDIIVRGEILFNEGDEVEKIVTDENGEFTVNDLYLGSYCLIDVENGLIECFEITSESTYSQVELTTLVEKTDVIITVVDGDEMEIDGVTAEVYMDDELIYTGVTNEEGIIKVKDLPKGNYCIKEKSVPSEYLLNDESFCIEIDDTSEVKYVKIINDKVLKKVIEVPNTFTDANILKIMVMILLLVGVGFYKTFLAFHRF